MKIWVDADALPGQIKEIIIKAAHKLCIETVFVSNKVISISFTTINTLYSWILKSISV